MKLNGVLMATVNGNFLHYIIIHFVVNCHGRVPVKFLINDNFTVICIVTSTCKE